MLNEEKLNSKILLELLKHDKAMMMDLLQRLHNHTAESNYSDANSSINEHLRIIDDADLQHDEYISTLNKVLLTLMIIIFLVNFLVGIIGNSLVLISVMVHKHMKNTTNILIFNLAIADFVFILICVPTSAFNLGENNWPFGDTGCRIVQYTTNVTLLASVAFLILMSLDRYLAIVKPISSLNYRNYRNTIRIVLLVWFLILIVSLPTLDSFVEYQYSAGNQTKTRCLLKYYIDESQKAHIRTYYIIEFTLAFALPLITILLIYGLVVINLCTHNGQQVSKRKKRVTCMVIIVVLCFMLCWGPVQLLIFCFHILGLPKNSYTLIAFLFFYGLGNLNSCLNPIIYGYTNKDFKR